MWVDQYIIFMQWNRYFTKGIGFLFIFISLFTGSAHAQYKRNFVVAKDGSGDYTTIQAAIDASKSFPYERITIHIKNGVYKEKVRVPEWNPRISLVGESREKTIITYDDYFNRIDRGRNSTFFTSTLLVQGNEFHAENLTIKNSAGPVGQAIALTVDADKVMISNCRLLGNQDTVYLTGKGDRQYFENCYIEGTTDFIFGQATAVFQGCEIHSKDDSYITAASTAKGVSYGFVFKDCRLTAEKDVTQVYLGRPWRKFARTVFLKCWMGNHIRPEGWDNWSNPENEKTAYYAEYHNNGPGYKPEKRVAWAHQLTAKEARDYRINEIFGNWNPKSN